MSQVQETAPKRPVAQAGIIAGSVFAFDYIVQVLSALLFTGIGMLQSREYSVNFFQSLFNPHLLLVILSFCVGVFLWFWLFAPRFAQLAVGGVIGHSLVAVGGGAIVSFVVSITLGMQAWFANAQFFSNSLGQATESFSSDWPNAFTMALSMSTNAALDALPVVVLAAVLVWVWSGRRHAAHEHTPTVWSV